MDDKESDWVIGLVNTLIFAGACIWMATFFQ
jgi:hypothetical protein